jgi:membrane-bound serine protease (ClpP class)
MRHSTPRFQSRRPDVPATVSAPPPWARHVLRLLALALLPFVVDPARAQEDAKPASDTAGEVIKVRIASIIHPVARDLLVEGIERADREKAAALVVELDTPGGLMTSTREMTTAMLGARTPIVVWVAPDGAQAASAGFFLLMAADFAAMAPSTNTGAAHPVGGQGESIEGDLGDKIEQDAAANIRALAARRGRPVELAEKAVVSSASFTAAEAKANGLVDLVAADEKALLAGLDGRELEKPAGEKRRLALAGARVVTLEMNGAQRFLSVLLHPNVAYILLSLGFLGLYFELSHPGAIFPGVVGGISLLLALYALSVLPVRFAGVALILLGIALLIAEIKVTSYGLLTVGGVGALVLGSLILFRSAEPALRVSRSLIAAVAFFFLAVTGLLLTLSVRHLRHRVQTGREAMIGPRAVARTALAPDGKVFVAGEWWNAHAEGAVAAGTQVEIVGIDGMTLHVRRLAPPSVESAVVADSAERS